MAMASVLFARAAAGLPSGRVRCLGAGHGAGAAALQSGRARGLGSESLPVAVLPGGHGAGVLAGGRRVGAGHGRVLAVEFKAPPSRVVKSACTKDGGADAPTGEDEAFERMYRILSQQMEEVLGLFIPLPIPLSKDETFVQEKMKEIADKCIVLIYDAMRRLPRTEKKRLNSVFWTAHFAFATVRSRAINGRASMEMALIIAQKLYVVLQMVSNGRSTPLPLDIKDAKKMLMPFSTPVFPTEHGVEVQVFAIIDDLYNAVKRDVDAMISDASRD